MLQGYKDGLSTDQVFQKTLNVDIKVFDKKFDDYIRARFAGVLPALSAEPPEVTAHMSNEELAATAAKSPNDFGVQLLVGMALLGHDKVDDAIPLLEKARVMFPEYGGDDSPYAFLAAAYEKKGDKVKETAMLKQWTSLTETNMKALMKLADLLQEKGDAAGAADALDRAIFINPFDVDTHKRLADLAHAAGDKARTIRERAALVALGPVDKADALYQLALAQHDAGDDKSARSSVLRALEEAPNYEKAQTLLLAIVDARGRAPEEEHHEHSPESAGQRGRPLVSPQAVSLAAAQRRGGRFSQFFGGPNDLLQSARLPRQSRVRRSRDVRAPSSIAATRNSGREGPGWSHDYPDAGREFHEDRARHQRDSPVRRRRADCRKRDRRTRRSNVVQVSRELHVGAGRLAAERCGNRRVCTITCSRAAS